MPSPAAAQLIGAAVHDVPKQRRIVVLGIDHHLMSMFVRLCHQSGREVASVDLDDLRAKSLARLVEVRSIVKVRHEHNVAVEGAKRFFQIGLFAKQKAMLRHVGGIEQIEQLHRSRLLPRLIPSLDVAPPRRKLEQSTCMLSVLLVRRLEEAAANRRQTRLEQATENLVEQCPLLDEQSPLLDEQSPLLDEQSQQA